jgi:hypothetical protein
VYNLTAGRVNLKLLKMKKVMLIALAVGLSLTANVWAQVPNYVPTNGLVGYWPFNGNANDESGNGNNGTVNGATLSADRFGNANKAYSFDGVDDYITINNTVGNFGTSDFTISLWYLANNLNASHLINKRYNESCGNWWEFRKEGFAVDQNSCINLLDQIFSVQPNVAQWYNELIVRQGNSTKHFVNGILVDSYNSVIIHNINNSNNVTIGCVLNPISGIGQKHNGKIDDIGIWNRALSECEIQDLYNSQLGSFSNANVSINPTSSSIGSNATLMVNSTISNLQWQSNPSNVGWVNLLNNTQYNGVTNDTLVVSNLQLSNHNQPFRVLACGDTSNIATIQIADTCITTIYDTLYTTVTDTLIINTTLSLPAPNNENTILIYPNPASDHITIDNGNFAAMAGYTIKIENNAGQQVFQSAINQAQFYVDLSTWTSNGLYFMHLIDPQNNTVTVRKIVLQ